jgi:SAM-dependent methyltransferase
MPPEAMMPHDAAAPPSPWISRFAPLIPARGPVLDLAAGAGRHARWLLLHGHPVTAVDRDTGGLADLADRPGATILQADLEAGDWPLARRRFAGVVVANYLYRPILPAILAAVAPGGVLIYETFGTGNAAFGRPRNPAFLLRPGELLAQATAGGLQVVAYEQGIDAAGPVVRQRLCAVRSGDAQPLYSAASASRPAGTGAL